MELSLTAGQYQLVYNLFSLTVATMFAAGLFFFGSRAQVAPRYRPALLISGLVVFIAGYHYFRIWESWQAAYTLSGGAYSPSGVPFNDVYRYADWLITVPLLLVELVAVLALAKSVARPMLRNLIVAAVAMIALGYPGEVATDAGTKWLFWTLSMIPFLYILYVLFVRLTALIAEQTGEVKALIARARNLILLSWWVYPVAFLLPMFGWSGAAGEVGLQVGYSLADLAAKALYGVVIYQIAKAKSDAEGFVPGAVGAAA